MMDGLDDHKRALDGGLELIMHLVGVGSRQAHR
jgi:hypothetical protein